MKRIIEWLLMSMLIWHSGAMQHTDGPKLVHCTGLTVYDIASINELIDRYVALLVDQSDAYDVEDLLQELRAEAGILCDKFRKKLGLTLLHEEMQTWCDKVEYYFDRVYNYSLSKLVIPELKLGLLILVPEHEIDWPSVNEQA